MWHNWTHRSHLSMKSISIRHASNERVCVPVQRLFTIMKFLVCMMRLLMNIVHSNYKFICISMQKVQSMSLAPTSKKCFSGWETRTTQTRWAHMFRTTIKKTNSEKMCSNSKKQLNSIDSVGFRIVYDVYLFQISLWFACQLNWKCKKMQRK